jgi:hypothetical protein
MIAYEKQLDSNIRWALQEGSLHFERQSAVHKSLAKITARLDELRIPFAVVGAMAIFFHGYRRFTEDINILVTKEGLQEILRRLEGLGCLQLFGSSKHIRDAETGVRIEFLKAGEFPGDGKPKPVVFPDPKDNIRIDGIPCIPLPKLVELKLASGISNPLRLKDLADVQELIQVLGLSHDFAVKLSPYVRDRFNEMLWAIENSPHSAPDKDAFLDSDSAR